MPDPITHYWFGQRVLSVLDLKIFEEIDPLVFDRALQGPDPWSTVGFYGGKNKRFACRSNQMHKEKTGEFLLALTAEAKRHSEVFSVLVGNICHYCLDRTVHPYIVYRSGDYDGTAGTYAQRSGHVKMERGIDSLIIRKYFRKPPWRFPIVKVIYKLKKYPQYLKQPLNSAYFNVYGWKDGFDTFNKGLKDEALFYGLMQDPVGVVRCLLRPMSRGHTNYSAYSYYKAEANAEENDYLNENHSEWKHPYDPSLKFTMSISEMIDKAKSDALLMISAAYDAVFKGDEIKLEQIYGNANYSTGFDCEDPRNKMKPVFDPQI